MRNGDIVTITIDNTMMASHEAIIVPETYTGTYYESGGALHEIAAKPGDIYRVYRIPCVKVAMVDGYHIFTHLDSKDIPAVPKTLVAKYRLKGYVGQQPIYEDVI